MDCTFFIPASTDAASSSSASRSIPMAKPVNELISEVVVTNGEDTVVGEDNKHSSDGPSNLQDIANGHGEECCSYSSSNRESWGRCLSLGGSDDEYSADCRAFENSEVPLSQVNK